MIDSRTEILENSRAFEHLEVGQLINFPNPPVQPFNPTAKDGDEKKKLKPAQLYGIAWMNSRLGEGGGIIGDQVGMGKVRIYISLELT